jgi:transposase-like protein
MAFSHRKFTTEFKEAAVGQLKTASVADVARVCKVILSVLYRWRRELGNLTTPVSRRQKYTREFKLDAIRRLDAGDPIVLVAESCKVTPKLLQSWRREAAIFGRKAFSGYGRKRSRGPATVAVKFLLSDTEHDRLVAAAAQLGTTERAAFLREAATSSADERPSGNIGRKLEELEEGVRRLAQNLQRPFDRREI